MSSLYQIAQCLLIIRDLSSDLYRLFFGRGLGGIFGGLKLKISIHPEESTGLLGATIYMGEVAKDIVSWTQLVSVLPM